MKPRRWQQVRNLFDRALEVDPAQRASFLADFCGADVKLRDEVLSLLAADAEVDPVVDRPAFKLRLGRATSARPILEGQLLGPYRVLREIGRGGLATVYLAARADREFDQRVAVKVIRRGMDTDEVVRRFRIERQVLANLEHPYIAKLLDGGSTAEGLPYFVMEWVRGKRLDAYCDARRLSTEARLRLFLQVCSAVQIAHQNLIVHRDLKPGNILVTAAGPKLLDFGLAKLLSPQGEPRTSLTRLGCTPMTPEYASPEQARGGTITTASDIYSLGIILYELLSGHKPYRLDDCDSLEGTRRICEQKPSRPSTAVGCRQEIGGRLLTPERVSAARQSHPGRLHRHLAGDLDSIVLKALRKDPQERYTSVEQLAKDLRRHLDGRPVGARHGTLTYHVGKLVRRHKLALAALVLIVTSGLTTTFLWRRAVAANREAVQQRQHAEHALEFLKSLFRAADPDATKGQDLSALDVLTRGEQRAEDLADPEVKADVLETLGFVYRDLGHYARARQLLERSVDIYRSLRPTDAPDLARSINNLAGLLYRMGASQEAEALFREALEMRRRLDQEDVDVAKAMCNLATILMNRGAYRAAEDHYLECLRIRESAYGRESLDVAMSLRSLGNLYYSWGRLGQAEPYLERAHGIHRRRLEAGHTRLALTLSSLGRLRLAQGKHSAAAVLLRQTLKIRLQRYGDDHPYVAMTKKDLAEVLMATGQAAAAETLLQQAFATLQESKRADSWEIAETQSLLCARLADQGHFQEAEPCLVESHRILLKTRGREAIHTRKAWQRLTDFYSAREKLEKGG